MDFMVNRSPLAGKDEKSSNMTSGAIKARLDKEILTNLSLRVKEESSGDSFTVKGRGTLQLGILMENMRREGFEIMVGAPQVLTRVNPETGAKEEPVEEVTLDVPSEYQGAVMEEYAKKGGVLQTMEAGAEENSLRIVFDIPTRGNIGIQGILMRRTKGSICISSQQVGWTKLAGDIKMRSRGAIIQMDAGKSTNYSLIKNKSKGDYFIKNGETLYPGMCIGMHIKEQDIQLNISKEKKATNMRASSADQTEAVPQPLDWGIDEFLGFMDTDELLEITPSFLRLSKKVFKR
jgi:GTP-binding protein